MTRIGGGKPPVERASSLSTLSAVFCRTVLPDALSGPSGGAGHACPVSESPGIIRSDSGRPALAGVDDMASRYPRFDTPPPASFCCGGLHFGSAAVQPPSSRRPAADTPEAACKKYGLFRGGCFPPRQRPLSGMRPACRKRFEIPNYLMGPRMYEKFSNIPNNSAPSR